MLRASLVVGAVAMAVVAIACSDDGKETAGAPQPDAGGDEGVTGPDVPPVAFPSTVPALFGYALEEAFPGTFLSGAMDIEWPAGSNVPFVLQRGGDIVRLTGTDPTLVLDFENQVALRAEAGALGMALHPKFADAADPHPFVYVWFNAEGAPTHQKLVRWTWDAAAGVFDPASALVLVDQTEGDPEHNGAKVRFGPDGFLYFANGDDTRTDETTQRLDGGLFSGIFRIDVDMNPAKSHAPPRQPADAVTQGYFIPNDNPFVGQAGVNEEYFALGFRNPYAFSFDRQTGDLWQGDVGDTFREEVNHIRKGRNYGWPFYEGTKRRRAGEPSIGTYDPPAYEYLHASIGDLVATMAGFVYRGAALPELSGKFLFSDWPTARIWALDTATNKRTSLVESSWSPSAELQENPKYAPVGWGQDAAGEVYVTAWSNVYKIVRAPAHAVPTKLSQTGIFRNTKTMLAPSSLVPYEIHSPLWSDAASKHRWSYIPAGTTATMAADGTITLPPGSLLVKQFDLPDDTQPTSGRTRRLETRVMVTGTDTTYGVTYRWNAEGTDADLVLDASEEDIGDADPSKARTWHFPSSGECWSCHKTENRLLGFRGEQLFTLPPLAAPPPAPAAIASPSDANATLEARATAYLAANCSHCHHPGASYLGEGDTWNARPGVPLAERGLVGAPEHNDPMAEALGLPNGVLIAPGNAAASLLLQRMKTTDPDLRMPPILRTIADPVGTKVVEDWINAMPAQQ